MTYSSSAIVLAVSLFLASPAASQTIPKDTCAIATAADLEVVLGKGVKPEPIGDEQCRWKGPAGAYEVQVRRQNGASELKEWTDFSMPKPVQALKGIGDEAFAPENPLNVVAFRKGNVAVRLSGSGVMKTAPMTYDKGVVELARRIAANIK